MVQLLKKLLTYDNSLGRYRTSDVRKSTPFNREKSDSAIKEPKSIVAKSTTIVESRNSTSVGQEAFFSAATISEKKVRMLVNGFFIYKIVSIEFIRQISRGTKKDPRREKILL